jgi:hypothetical protein
MEIRKKDTSWIQKHIKATLRCTLSKNAKREHIQRIDLARDRNRENTSLGPYSPRTELLGRLAINKAMYMDQLSHVSMDGQVSDLAMYRRTGDRRRNARCTPSCPLYTSDLLDCAHHSFAWIVHKR